MAVSLHETCLQYFRRRISEGWKCVSLEGYNAVLLSPDGIRRELDLRNDIETLRPNAVGSLTGIGAQEPATGEHWDKVDEAIADNNTTYVKQPGYAQKDLYALPAHSGSGVIRKVTAYARGISSKPEWGDTHTFIRTHEVNYTGNFVNSGSWTTVKTEYTTNPNTGTAWTWAEIDALEAGCYLYGRAPWLPTVKCTQVYVEVETVAAPTVTTVAANNVEETTANPKGNVTNTGGENPTRHIDYGTSPGSYPWSKNCGVGGTGVYNSNLTGLSPGTKYYYRARAVNSGGTGTGSEMTFITKPNPPTNLIATAV
ncbi:unnamed protein product [marine sediment metagenome]|uniref:Fibronectin type-III domain-containing protein n=1 Tax=marine sediment metagenome TaxID=412755 RepID=X1SID1_9ZZZZ